MPDILEMSESLRRQRRNLIVTSLIVTFILYSKVEVSKINIFGIEVITPNQNALINILWLVWAYFLIRFYQYLRVEPGEGFISKFKKKYEAICFSKIMNQVNPNEEYPKLTMGDCSVWSLRKISHLKWVLPITEHDSIREKKVEISEEEVSTFLLFRQACRAMWFTIAHTPKFSDNVLPFLLAFMTAVYGVLNYLK